MKVFQGNVAPLILRHGLATIMIFHGYLKIAIGGGVTWAPEFPDWIQLLVGWTEFLAGICLLFGLLTRVAALCIIVIQIGAVATYNGDFIAMRDIDAGRQGFDFRKVGYEYNFAIIVIALTVVILGPGTLALDHVLFRRKTAASVQSQPAGTATLPVG